MFRVFKTFMSPLNVDSYSYASQFGKLSANTFPLMALGYACSEKLEMWASIALIVTVIMAIVAMFCKKKICPRWLRDTISGALTTYSLFCLPAIILVCIGKNGWFYDLFMDDNREALIFGVVVLVFSIISDVINNRKMEKKRSANENK